MQAKTLWQQVTALLLILFLLLPRLPEVRAQQLSLSVQDRGGAALPGSCSETGSRFTLTTNATLYICNGSTYVLSSGTAAFCTLTRTSSTVLTFAPSASASTPCVLNIGNKGYAFTAAITFTIAANGGTGYVYMSSAGAITLGYGGGTFAGGNVTTSGGTATFGVTAFPTDSVPRYIVTATTATWDTTITPWTAEASASRTFTAGTGITLTQTADNLTIASGSSSPETRLDLPAYSGYYSAGSPNGVPAIALPTSAAATTKYFTFYVPDYWTGTLADVTVWVSGEGTDNTKTYRVALSVGCSGLAGAAIVYNTASNFNMNDSATANVAIKTTVTSVDITNCVAGAIAVLRVVDPGTTAAVYTSPANHHIYQANIKWH